MKKAFFFAVSNNPNIDEKSKKNFEYSNFVYSVCLQSLINLNNSIENQDDKYNIELFKRHDMLTVDNIKDNVFKCMVEYDTFIVLIDQIDGSYNANVWFELGIIATQENKNIILISKDIKKRFPFYISDVDVIIIDKPLYDWFWQKKEEFVSLDDILDSQKKSFFNDMTEPVKKNFSRLEQSLIKKLTYGKNPFQTQVEHTQLQTLGYGNITNLLKDSHIIDLIKKDSTVAEFINGEEAAFNELVKAVKDAKKSLRTTRSANQSIVGHHTEKEYHTKFMKTLYGKSKHLERFDRLICNNNYAKWLDVRDMLLEGGKNTRIFIRKRFYALGFELVVIDNEISFIHFYQLNDNSGNSPDISSKPNTNNERLNSTLKIKGSFVSKHLADLFDRFHHRDFGKNVPKNPSSTILGMPDEKDDDKPHDIACLKLPLAMRKKIDKETNIEEKKEIVNDYLWEKFKTWHKQMSVKDRVIMGTGISALNKKYAIEILANIETYFPYNKEIETTGVNKEQIGRESFYNDLKNIVFKKEGQFEEILAAVKKERVQKQIRTEYNAIKDKQAAIKNLNKSTEQYYKVIQNEEVTDNDINQALALDKEIFDIPNSEQFNIDKCKRWNEKTGLYVYTMLKDPETDKVVGYINIVPVTDECYEKIKDGKDADINIDDSDIVSYEQPIRPKKYNLYLAAIVVDTKKDRLRRTHELFNAFMDKLITLTTINIIYSRMIADAITEDGKDLCHGCGMSKIKDTEHDNSTIYEIELYPPKFPVKKTKEKLNELYDILMKKYNELGDIDA